MKHLKKYHNYLIKENKSEVEERDELLSNLIDMLSDLIDDEYQINLVTDIGHIRLNNIINNRSDETLNRFKPVYTAGNKIISWFKLIIFLRNDSNHYDSFSEIVGDMSSVVGRLGDIGWIMKNFDAKQDVDTLSEKNKKPGKFTSISYKFSRPTIKVEGKITEEQIRLEFDKIGLGIESIKFGDNIIEIGAESKSYDGKIPDDIVEYLDIIKNRLGIDYYEHESMGTWLRVKFWIDDPDNEEVADWGAPW